jgi:hypothetical protein
MQENSIHVSCSLGKTPRNSKHSFSNVNYISGTWTLIVIPGRLPLHCPTFGMLLKNGLNLVSLDLPMSLWNGLITGKLSWMNSVPSLDLTMKLVMPNMS